MNKQFERERDRDRCGYYERDTDEAVLTTNGLEPEDEYERRQRGQGNAGLILVVLALLTMVGFGLYAAAWIGTVLAPLLPR